MMKNRCEGKMKEEGTEISQNKKWVNYSDNGPDPDERSVYITL